MTLIAIVKATHDCNMRCKYCYIDPNAESGRMSYPTLTRTMEELARSSDDQTLKIIWHGGEPLLMGLDFYKEVASISRSLRAKGYYIKNGMQTNGTLIEPKTLDFIAREEDFRLGLSLDGPEEINNRTRVYAGGRGTFQDVFRGIKMVRDYQAGHRVLGGGVVVVVTKNNIDDLQEIYNFFKQEKIPFKINPLIMAGRADKEMAITPEEWATATNALFDFWANDPDYSHVDPFEDVLGSLMTGCPVNCNFSESCRKRFISVGPQGDIYPCGRFDGTEGFKLGNVHDSGGIVAARNSEIHRRLATRTVDTIPGCGGCKFKEICNGGCMHNAYTSGNLMGRDPYCSGYQKIFSHAEEFLHRELTKAEVKK